MCSGKVPQGFSRPIPGIRHHVTLSGIPQVALPASRKRQRISAVEGASGLGSRFAWRSSISAGSAEEPFPANRVGFERRPERRVYPRLRTLDRLRPLSWSGGPRYLGQPTPLGEVRQDRL